MKFIDDLAVIYPDSVFRLGISTETQEIERAPEYFNEAIVALRMTTAQKKVVLYESLGIAGVLINSNNIDSVRKMAKRLLGPLYEGESRSTDLLKTLYVFLENGGNLEHTMEKLSLSKSGLRYRITRIETLLQQNLRDPEVGYQLFLTLQALLAIDEIAL